MKRKIIVIPAIVFAILIALFIGKNMIIKTSVTTGVKAMTGLKLSIRSMNVGVFKSLIGINGLQLHNPQGFEDELMIDFPEIYVDYNLGAFMKGKTHLEEVRLHLKEFIVVKNEAGELNLNSLKVVKAAEDEKGGEEETKKGDGAKEKTKMPDIQIDLLALKIDRVIYKDYSKGGSPKVKEYNVNIDERYVDITDPQSLGRLIIVKALKNTTIARLANFDIGKLQKGLAETVRKTAAKAMETQAKAVEAGHDLIEEKASETAKDAVEKASDAIKKFLPFGNKEKK
jgi:histone H3/H4